MIDVKNSFRTGILNLNMVGKEVTNNSGYIAVITKYVNSKYVTIKFLKPYIYVLTTTLGNLRNGNFTNIMAPSIYGIGITGGVSNKNIWYEIWRGMIRRCYCPKALEKNSTYVGCTIVKEWHYLPNFIKWAEKQIYNKGYDIDKDWLHPKNKIYGPKFCVFAPHEINSFLVNNKAFRGAYLLGVNLNKRNGTFIAHVFNSNKQHYLKSYLTENEAHYAYVVFKEKCAKELAKFYKLLIPLKLYKAMRKYKVADYN